MANLREAQNNVNIEGVLAEKSLEKRKLANGNNYIAGDLNIRVNDDNEVVVRMFCSELKKDGTPNKIYTSIETIMNTYKTLKDGKDAAETVRINGARLQDGSYYNKDGRLIEKFNVSTNFVNRIKAEDMNPKAVFDVEVFILALTEEIGKDGESTGRVVIKGAVPGYQGRVDVFDFIVATPEGVKYVNKNYEVGDTVKIGGNIINSATTVETVTENAFGGDTVDTKTFYVRELSVVTGSEPIRNGKEFEEELIQKGVRERKTRLDEQKQKVADKEKEKSADTGFGSDDDLPF